MLERFKFLPSMLEEATASVGVDGQFVKFKLGSECLFNDAIIKSLEGLKRSLIWDTFFRVGNSHAERSIFGENACTTVEDTVDFECSGIEQTVKVKLTIPYVREETVVQELSELKRRHNNKDSIEAKLGFLFCDISSIELIVGDIDSYNTLLKAVEDEFIPY